MTAPTPDARALVLDALDGQARAGLALPYTPDMFESRADPTPAQDAQQLAMFETGTAGGHS